VRGEIYNRIMRYTDSDDESALLIRVPAGVGKSYHATRALQDWTSETGARALYTVDRHNWWADLAGFDIFEPELWYHWLPITDGSGEIDETCRYAKPLITWLQRGYPGIEYCLQTCAMDRWIQHCPYREQRKRKERLIFAMHQHLVTGMAISDYDMVVIDEFPLKAFLDHRYIPAGDIVPPGAGDGPVGDLFRWIEFIAASGDIHPRPPGRFGRVRDKELMDIIGPYLGDVFAEVELGRDILPTIPRLVSPDDAFSVPNFYWYDLLSKLSPEYEYWKADREAGDSRAQDGLGESTPQNRDLGCDRDRGAVPADSTTGHRDIQSARSAARTSNPGRWAAQRCGNGAGGKRGHRPERRERARVVGAGRAVARTMQGHR
jgi:hypothetical protein